MRKPAGWETAPVDLSRFGEMFQFQVVSRCDAAQGPAIKTCWQRRLAKQAMREVLIVVRPQAASATSRLSNLG